jgi:Cu/Ag efflux pump CusA
MSAYRSAVRSAVYWLIAALVPGVLSWFAFVRKPPEKLQPETIVPVEVQQVKAALAAQNLSLPGGNLRSGYKDFLIRTPGEFSGDFLS